MFAYAAGHCGVPALAGASRPLLARYLTWSGRGVSLLRRVCGALVLGGGLYLVYAAPQSLGPLFDDSPSGGRDAS